MTKLMKSCLFNNIELTDSFGNTGGIIVDEVGVAMLFRLVFGHHYFGEVTTAPHNNKYSAYGLFYDHQFIRQEFIDRMLGL